MPDLHGKTIPSEGSALLLCSPMPVAMSEYQSFLKEFFCSGVKWMPVKFAPEKSQFFSIAFSKIAPVRSARWN
jgi:hypothetical protein